LRRHVSLEADAPVGDSSRWDCALTLEFFEGAVLFPSYRERWVAVGEFRDETVIAVVFVRLGAEAISLVSMRPASRKERRIL
jgi:uncharacterized DUF497 family protein